MKNRPEFGDPGFDKPASMGWLMNVGARIARSVGKGLALVNKIWERFPGATRQEAGELAAQVGRAVGAAEELQAAPSAIEIAWPTWPPIPDKGLWGDNQGERWGVAATVSGTTSAGEEVIRSTTYFGTETITKEELEERIKDAIATQDAAERSDKFRAINSAKVVDFIYVWKQF